MLATKLFGPDSLKTSSFFPPQCLIPLFMLFNIMQRKLMILSLCGWRSYGYTADTSLDQQISQTPKGSQYCALIELDHRSYSFRYFTMAPEEEEQETSRLEDIKYYTSLFLGTLAIIALFAFLFLVPFVLDPAISTMMHAFVEEPVHCKVRSLPKV